jgi:hypothetical protein
VAQRWVATRVRSRLNDQSSCPRRAPPHNHTSYSRCESPLTLGYAAAGPTARFAGSWPNVFPPRPVLATARARLGTGIQTGRANDVLRQGAQPEDQLVGVVAGRGKHTDQVSGVLLPEPVDRLTASLVDALNGMKLRWPCPSAARVFRKTP